MLAVPPTHIFMGGQLLHERATHGPHHLKQSQDILRKLVLPWVGPKSQRAGT